MGTAEVRAYDRMLGLNRTLAGIGGKDKIEQVSEAIQYGTLDRSLWA